MVDEDSLQWSFKKKSEKKKTTYCLIRETLIELTADALPFPVYMHGFA